MSERCIGMFDNPIIAEIKRDIISSLPKGANLNELNIMDLWVKNYRITEQLHKRSCSF